MLQKIISFIFFTLTLSAKPWMEKAVQKEFIAFEKTKVSKELLEKTWENCKKYKEFKRFQIIDQKVYGEDCKIKRLLEKLTETYTLPNVDFIYFNEDRIKPSFFKRSRFKKTAPIFVSAKEKGMKSVILFSDWVYDIKETHGGWNKLIQTMNANQHTSWKDKKNSLFWRGTPWDGKRFNMYTFQNWKTIPRGTLVFLSQKMPSLINAAFSEYPEKCRHDLNRCENEMGEIEFVPWTEVISHKYQMAIDGVTCSFPATQWKFLSGSAVFFQESKNVMFWYDELIPYKHYIPVKENLSDLISKLKWAQENDSKVREIAENGRKFAQENLMPEHILLYCYKTLLRYSELQTFNPEIQP